MAQITALQPYGVPGRTRTFSAKLPAVFVAIHILSTIPVVPNHVFDSGNNLLIAGDIEIQGKMYCGDVDNFFQVDADGEITLHGTGRVLRHWIIDPERFKMPAANFPAEGFEGIFPTLDFDKATNESAYVPEHVPYRLAVGTKVVIMVDWLFDAADAGVVVWGIKYRIITPGDTIAGATTDITKASAGGHTEGKLLRTTFVAEIDVSGANPDDNIGIQFFRDADNLADTLNQDARILNVHFHFIQDKLGEPT